jgi:hypothetical protein
MGRISLERELWIGRSSYLFRMRQKSEDFILLRGSLCKMP